MAKRTVHIGSVIGPGVPNRNSFVSVRPRYRFVDGDTINWPDREKYQFENGEVTIPNLEDTYLGEDLVWEFTFENLDTRNQPLAGVRVETVTFEGTSGSTVDYVDMQQVEPSPLPNYEQVAVDQAQAAAAAAAVSAAQAATLVQWAKNPDQIITGTITRNSDDVITSAQVVWPDGSPGTFTTDTIDTSGAINAYHITYGSPATKTFTQPTLTRNSSGAVTSLPAIVVT